MNTVVRRLAALPAVLPKNPMLIPNGTRTELKIHDMLPEQALPILRKGYRTGGQRALDICGCIEDAIADVTFFGLAIQNLQRPEWQIDALMEGAIFFCDQAMERGYGLHPFGHVDEFKDVKKYQPLYERLYKVRSGDYKPWQKLMIHVAVNYSGVGKYELDPLVKSVRLQGEKEMAVFNPMEHILSAGVPDSDLVIRTGGEHRLSGFCMLQAAYAELRFEDISWMHYRPDRFIAALHWFAKQKRNNGK